MAKYRNLISKYHRKNRENFVKLFEDSAGFFLGVGSKTKARNWWKVFYDMLSRRLDIPNFKQRPCKVS